MMISDYGVVITREDYLTIDSSGKKVMFGGESLHQALDGLDTISDVVIDRHGERVMTIAYLGDDIYRVGMQDWGEGGFLKFKYERCLENNLEELVRGYIEGMDKNFDAKRHMV